MLDTPIHVIDFEGSRHSGVVEYGVVTLLGDQISATYGRLCAPIGAISAREQMQHGISLAHTAEQAVFEQEWDLFAALRQSGPFCAHNAAVEDGFLRAVWAYPRTSPDFSRQPLQLASWGPWLDTLYLYRRIYPQLQSHKLQQLIECFDLGPELNQLAHLYCPPLRLRYHCALYDALASALLLRRLYTEPSLAEMSLRWLILNSAASQQRRDAMGQMDLL